MTVCVHDWRATNLPAWQYYPDSTFAGTKRCRRCEAFDYWTGDEEADFLERGRAPSWYLNPDPLYEPGPEPVIRWHAEPVRAAHHRRVGFLFGLVAGIVVTLILTAVRDANAATPRHAPEPRWVPVHIEESSSWGDPSLPGGSVSQAAEPTAHAASVPGLIVDPFPASPQPERAAVAVPEPVLVVREKATPRPAKGGSSVAAARSYALSTLGPAQFACFDVLMVRESNWNPRAYNASSGAYGIPQAVPGSKMAAYGADWRTNPVTQVRWGIAYVASRYGSACAALSHSYAVGWY